MTAVHPDCFPPGSQAIVTWIKIGWLKTVWLWKSFSFLVLNAKCHCCCFLPSTLWQYLWSSFISCQAQFFSLPHCWIWCQALVHSVTKPTCESKVWLWILHFRKKFVQSERELTPAHQQLLPQGGSETGCTAMNAIVIKKTGSGLLWAIEAEAEPQFSSARLGFANMCFLSSPFRSQMFLSLNPVLPRINTLEWAQVKKKCDLDLCSQHTVTSHYSHFCPQSVVGPCQSLHEWACNH